MMTPTTEQDLAECVAAATGPLHIIGGGTRDIGQPQTGQVLCTTAMTGIQLYEPGALTLVVRAGTPVSAVETLLADQRQRLAFEPMDHRVLLATQGTPTIGGVVAANVSGPRRIQVGAARDVTLGVRFVDGRGQVLKSGGRVMKNVTGYDLVKLLAGSWGTLGVISEISLKVQAIPETEATLLTKGLSARDGVAALSAGLRSPFDITGAAHVGGGATMLRLEGLSGSVAYRAARLRAGACAGWDLVEGPASADLWRDIRDVRHFAGSEKPVWRLSLKPTDGPKVTDALAQAGLDHQALYDWGGGLVWLQVSDEPDAGAALIRQTVAAHGGHATLVRAPEDIRNEIAVFQTQPTVLATITRQIQQKFDPRGILNPGLMGA